MSISDIEKQITQYKIQHLVITGGEPLMQQDELAKLISGLNELGFFVEVETNCTIKPTKEMLELVNQWNVSPKTSNSGNKLELYENNECYNLFTSLENAIFKFVVENEGDMNEINGFIKKYEIVKNRVLLMPQASRKKELSLLSRLIKDIAKSNDLGFSPRLHIEKWDNQRGT